MRLALILAFALTLSPTASGQAAYDDEPTFQDRFRSHAIRLFQAFRSLQDWETQSEYVIEAAEKIYARNDWNSEPDQFSLDVLREVNQVPLWDQYGRFDTAMSMIRDRYALTTDQERRLRTAFIAESNDMFRQHSGRIMSYVVDAIQTRAAGEPFTPEQVARWVQTAEPVFLDSRSRMNDIAAQLAPELTDDQRALMEADLSALNRRLDDVYVMSERWAAGDWRPSDWGMEDDPIQNQARLAQALEPDEEAAVAQGNEGVRPEPRRPARGGAAGGPPARTAKDVRVVARSGGAEETDPWAEYVRRFIRKYRLVEQQQAKAWKIYRDVKNRADQLRQRYATRISAAEKRVSSPDDADAQAVVKALRDKVTGETDKLFEALKSRLERLPTREQRRTAGPDELEPKAESGAQRAPVNPDANDGP